MNFYLIRPIEKWSCNMLKFHAILHSLVVLLYILFTFTNLLCVMRFGFPSIVFFAILLMLSPVRPREMSYQVWRAATVSFECIFAQVTCCRRRVSWREEHPNGALCLLCHRCLLNTVLPSDVCIYIWYKPGDWVESGKETEKCLQRDLTWLSSSAHALKVHRMRA